jgi:putative hemolysin
MQTLLILPDKKSFKKAAIAEPAEKSALISEINQFSDSDLLARQGSLEVYLGTAQQMPNIIHEIGRLREISFRAVGEGTGKPLDLDKFDTYYLHLILWDKDQHCIAGAYRLGCTDHIFANYGSKGIISSSSFEFEQPFIDFLNPGLELGRAFVAPSHQKSIFALALLWKGITHFVAENPRYSKLFGMVSISNNYTRISQDIIVKYLRKSHLNDTVSKWVKPTNPFKEIPTHFADISFNLTNVEQVAAKVSESEKDGKTIPVLLRQYLKMNATLLEFNVDADFENCLDALVLVDLHEAPAVMLTRYMGKEAYLRYRETRV